MKEMSPEQRELFRIALLRVLEINGSSFGLGVTALATLVSTYGFSVKPEVVTREVEYLSDPAIEFVAAVNKANFSTENRAWKISAKGRNFLAERGY
jgi:hypothetical protein